MSNMSERATGDVEESFQTNDFSSYWNAEQTERISCPFIWAEWQSCIYSQIQSPRLNVVSSWFILISVPFKTQERKPWATSSSNIPHCPSEGFTVTGHVLHFTSSLPAALYVFSDKAGVNRGTVVISSDNNSCSFFIPIKHRQHKNCVC